MKIKALIVLFLPFSMALAQESKTSFSLSEAQSYAVENHLKVKNAELEYEEAKKKVQETTAIGLPQMSASADYRYNINIPVTVVDAKAFDPNAPDGVTVPVQFGQNNNATLSFTATQLIFDGTFFVGLQASKTYKQLMDQAIDKTEISVKDMVARSYYNALIALENKKVFEENVQKLESQKNQLEQLYLSGFMEEIEVDQIDLILSEAQKRSLTIERQVKVMYQLLNFQMGREIDAPLELSENLASIYANYDESALLNSELSLEEHIDYQLISTQEKLRMLQIKSDKVSRLPKIGAMYNYAQNSYVNPLENNIWYKSSFVGVSLSMPIFTSTMNSSKLQQSKIQLSKLQNEKQILEDNLKIEVSMARTAYIDALEQFRMEEKNLTTSKKIFDITTTKQKNGLASSMDVTITNNQYLQTQGNYINALYRILEAKATLDKALNKY